MLSEMGVYECIINSSPLSDISHQLQSSLTAQSCVTSVRILSPQSSIHLVANRMYIKSAVTQEMCKEGQIYS